MNPLDANDPLARYRERFLPTPGLVSYLDGNSLGRPLAASVERVETFLREEWAGKLIRGWDDGWMSQPLTTSRDTPGVFPITRWPTQRKPSWLMLSRARGTRPPV